MRAGTERSERRSPVAPPRHRAPRYLLAPTSGPALDFVVHRLWAAHGRRERSLRSLAPLLPARLLRRPARIGLRSERERHLLTEALALAPGVDDATSDWLLVCDAHRPDRGRVLALAVAPDGRPRRALKIAHSRAARDALDAEAAALAGLRRRLPTELLPTVPEPTGPVLDAGLEVLGLSAFDGRSQYVDLHADLWPGRWSRGHMAAAGTWLGRFHRATAEDDGGPLPSVELHGDFWPGNVIRTADGPRVVDWEHAGRRGNPLDDVVSYVIGYAGAAAGDRWTPPFARARAALEGQGTLAPAVREFLAAYRNAFGLDRLDLDARLLAHLGSQAEGTGGSLEPDPLSIPTSDEGARCG